MKKLLRSVLKSAKGNISREILAISYYRTLEQTYNRIDAKLVYDPNDYNTYRDVSFVDFKQEMGK